MRDLRSTSSHAWPLVLGLSLLVGAACTNEPAPNEPSQEGKSPAQPTPSAPESGPQPGDADSNPDTSPEVSRPSRGPGIAVGEPAPAFKLMNSAGEAVELGSLLPEAPLALVFFRSADW